jgi:hypothetical protein
LLLSAFHPGLPALRSPDQRRSRSQLSAFSQSIGRKAVPNATEKHHPGARDRRCVQPGPIARSGTFLQIPSLDRHLTEDFNGKSSMEAAWLADRQEGSAESKPLVQTSVTAALVDDGREQAEATRKGQHPDRRDER